MRCDEPREPVQERVEDLLLEMRIRNMSCEVDNCQRRGLARLGRPGRRNQALSLARGPNL